MEIDSEINAILENIKSIFLDIPAGPTESGFWENLEQWKNPNNRNLYGPKGEDTPTNKELDVAEFWNPTDTERKTLAKLAELGCYLHSEYPNISV